eukprot:5922996-Ditylum_brightwellii.AAC.1
MSIALEHAMPENINNISLGYSPVSVALMKFALFALIILPRQLEIFPPYGTSTYEILVCRWPFQNQGT